MNQGPPSGAEIAIALVFYGVFILIAIGIQIFISYVMYRANSVIPEEERLCSPGQAFLLLIPLFNFVWLFIYTKNLSNSFVRFFSMRGVGMGDCGEKLGMWWGICTICSIIPCLNIFFGIGGLIVMILYLVKVTECRGNVLAMLNNQNFGMGYATAPVKQSPPSNNPYSY